MRSPAFIKYLLLFILVNVLHPNSSLSQDSIPNYPIADTIRAADSTHVSSTIPEPDDEFNLFVLLFGTAAVCFMLGFVFLGLVAAFILLVIFIILLTTGILSISVISGWYKKSVVKGIKTLFVLLGMLGGVTCGILGFGLISLLFKLGLEQRTIALAGSITGAVAGLVLALIVFKMLMLALKYIQKKFNLKQEDIG